MNQQHLSGGNIAPALNDAITRIEKLMEDKAAVQSDIREVYKEAKGKELNVKTIREIIKLRKMDTDERDEQEHLRDVYLRALGLLDFVDE